MKIRIFIMAVLLMIFVTVFAADTFETLKESYPVAEIAYFQSGFNSGSIEIYQIGVDFVIFEDEDGIWIVHFEE